MKKRLEESLEKKSGKLEVERNEIDKKDMLKNSWTNV